MRKFVVGFLWFLGLYFVACGVTGGVAGSMAAKDLPPGTSQEWANQVAMTAAAETVLELRVYFFAGALVIAVVGSTSGWLPGTRSAAQQRQRRPLLDAGLHPSQVVDAPVGLTQTADLYRRRNDS